MIRIVASAAYIDQELSAEFGQIPPSFLPVGVSRLYEFQIARLPVEEPIYLTIPDSFAPQPYDRKRLQELNVVLVPVPDGLRIGESIVYALNTIGSPPGPVQILHGDTLIDDIPDGRGDLIAIHAEGDDYSWASVGVEAGYVVDIETITAGSSRKDERPVACGYFSFSSSSALVRAITRVRGDFVEALKLYTTELPLHATLIAHWQDFGHIQTYFRSRRAVTTARSFNRLSFDAVSVRKSSSDVAKIQAEAEWLGGLPPTLLPFSARLLDVGHAANLAFYTTEYQYAPTLSELFVFSSISRTTWQKIMGSCEAFLETCAAYRGGGSADDILRELAVTKTISRLERYAVETGFDIDADTRLDGRPLPSLRRITEEMAKLVDLRSGRRETIMHGDFCFSNILYNSRSARISVIDPRGYAFAGQMSMFGDIRYDLAKLSHSIIGRYDHILSGRYALQRNGSHDFAITFESAAHDRWLQEALSDLIVDGVGAASLGVLAVTVGLFLSMVPLHADRPDRQAAFIANALRLYSDL